MKLKKRYTATTVGATSVTLTPSTGYEDETKNGNPGLVGTGTVVVTQGVTPDATYWKTGYTYLVEIDRIS